MTALAPHLTAFFHERLAVEIHASVNTCEDFLQVQNRSFHTYQQQNL